MMLNSKLGTGLNWNNGFFISFLSGSFFLINFFDRYYESSLLYELSVSNFQQLVSNLRESVLIDGVRTGRDESAREVDL